MDHTPHDAISDDGQEATSPSMDHTPHDAISDDGQEAASPSVETNADDTNGLEPETMDLSTGDSALPDADNVSSKRAREYFSDDSSDDEPPNKHFFDTTDGDRMRRLLIKPGRIQVSFDDVHVNASIVEALSNITLPLEYPEAFGHGILSKRSPASVLLYGPPGTGKTQLVRALAKQARCKILTISNADIRDKYAGVGEKMIKDLFWLARREYPCLVFIDEADCVFHKRTAESRTHDQALLSEFLVAMDGIGSRGLRDPVVIAATNRPFDIDEGILRRLSRRIMVDMPDAAAREKILAVHVRDESLAADVDLAALAAATVGYSGADLRNLVYSAALIAVREQLGDRRAPPTQDTRRVLRKEHFERAKRQTPPAPVAGTLAMIREFHNQHGDTMLASDTSGPESMTKEPVLI